MSRRLVVAAIVAIAAALSTPIVGKDAPGGWRVPNIRQLPNDKYGEMVRYGRELVENTHAKEVAPRRA